jgi:transketolase
MRNDLLDVLYERMAEDESIFFLVADMGINLVERFAEAYPRRFLNVGIAEQDLIGVSAGLCNAGFRPFAYTISNFLTQRCFEQVRNDIALLGYPVTLLGTSAGFDNAPLGPTHHIIDDWGAIAGIPGIDIYSPSSVPFARALVDLLIRRDRPAYVRIPKGEPAQPACTDDVVYIQAAKPHTLLASYGAPAQNCLQAASGRADLSVLIFNRLRPINWEAIEAALQRHDQTIIVEDHFPEQGLYGTLCRLVQENGLRTRLRSLAPTGFNFTVGGNSAFYHKLYKLDAAGILSVVGGQALVEA